MAEQPPVGFVGPQVVQERALLIEVAELAGLLFVVGFVREIDYVCRALFGGAAGLAAHIPWLGKKLANGLHAIEHRLSHALGAAEHSLEPRMGAAFHALSGQVLGALELVAALAITQGYLEWLVVKRFALATLGPAISRVQRSGKTVTVNQTKIITKTKVIEKTINNPGSGKIGASVGVQLKPLKSELRHFEQHTNVELKRLNLKLGKITVARPAARPADPSKQRREDANQNKRLKRLENLGVGTLVAGSVGWTLAKLGAGFLQCRNVKDAGRATCAMDSGLLDALMMGTTLLLGPLSVVTLAEACLSVEADIVSAMGYGVKELRNIDVPGE